MDLENELFVLGVVVGWITTIISTSIIGVAFMSMNKFELWGIIVISAGILVGLFIIGGLVSFLMNYKIVRREK